MSRDERPAGTQSADRALTILELFTEQRWEVSIAEAAMALGVHRSTASRLLATLVHHRFLEQDEASGRFRLGLALLSLGGIALNRFPVRACARQALRDLRDATGESVYLGVLDGLDVVYIDQVSSPRVNVNVDWVGRRQSLVESSSGHLLLAFQPQATVEKILADSERESLVHELTFIRVRGHAVRFDESEDGNAGVAAPIRDYRGAVVAAVSVGGPRVRVDRRRLEGELLPLVLRSAAQISASLGDVAA